MRTMWRSLGDGDFRLSSIGGMPAPDRMVQLRHALAQSWGVRESILTGDVHSRFVPTPFIQARAPPGGSPMLCDPGDPGKLWVLEAIPVQLREILKRDVLEKGEEEKWMVPQAGRYLEALRKRMSRRVYVGYPAGEWEHPTPLVDNVSPRYGAQIKKKAELMLRCALGIREIGLKKLAG